MEKNSKWVTDGIATRENILVFLIILLYFFFLIILKTKNTPIIEP